MFTASKSIDVIDVNIVYRIFEFIKEKKNTSIKASRSIDISNINIVYRIFELILADTQPVKQSSK